MIVFMLPVNGDAFGCIQTLHLLTQGKTIAWVENYKDIICSRIIVL